MNLWHVLLVAAAIGSGIAGGVFFAFSTFVMQALARQPAAAAIATMQAINVTVINPLFLGIFLGTALVCAVLLGGTALGEISFALAAAGAVFYLAGIFGVTMLANVPRNERLARLSAESAEAEEYWPVYVREWSRWNHLRAAAGILAASSFILALHFAQG